MKKIKLKYPQMVAEFKEVEITDAEFDALPHFSTAEKAQFIDRYLNEREQQHIPGELSAAVEYGYAAIIVV